MATLFCRVFCRPIRWNLNGTPKDRLSPVRAGMMLFGTRLLWCAHVVPYLDKDTAGTLEFALQETPLGVSTQVLDREALKIAITSVSVPCNSAGASSNKCRQSEFYEGHAVQPPKNLLSR